MNSDDRRPTHGLDLRPTLSSPPSKIGEEQRGLPALGTQPDSMHIENDLALDSGILAASRQLLHHPSPIPYDSEVAFDAHLLLDEPDIEYLSDPITGSLNIMMNDNVAPPVDGEGLNTSQAIITSGGSSLRCHR